MPVDQRVVDRLDALLNEAKAIDNNWGGWNDPTAEQDRLNAFIVSACGMLERTAGKGNRYLGHMAWDQNPGQMTKGGLRRAVGAVRAFRDDYAGGWLSDPREIGAGEVFADFLGMSEHLLDNGYHVPAASLAGGVLEDLLRRLHLKHIGQWDGESSITKLNDALRKASVYTQPQWRQIQVWGDIRNEADHGHFDKVDPITVKAMILGVRDFVIKHTA